MKKSKSKREYPRIQCNDIVNNSRHRFANCNSDHWIDSVLMVKDHPGTCRYCDLRQPVPTKEDRILRCRQLIKSGKISDQNNQDIYWDKCVNSK
jgi:hypothetical protein